MNNTTTTVALSRLGRAMRLAALCLCRSAIEPRNGAKWSRVRSYLLDVLQQRIEEAGSE